MLSRLILEGIRCYSIRVMTIRKNILPLRMDDCRRALNGGR